MKFEDINLVINVKYELDEESLKKCFSDKDKIEAEHNKCKTENTWDMTKHFIPARIEDVCAWWINEYPCDDTLKFNTRYDTIRQQMIKILDSLDG